MIWRFVHRWLGLVAGTLALVLGITGTMLALDPLRNAVQAAPTESDLPLATLVERIKGTVPGAEEIRHLPSGIFVVYAFEDGQAQAVRVDPADGKILGDYQASLLPRWVKNLHRTFLMDDPGRITAAMVALAMLVLSVSGLLLLLRRMGGWRGLAGPVRGTLPQRLHVLSGRVIVLILALSSATALYMSASTFELITLSPDTEPEVSSQATGQPPLPPDQIELLRSLRAQDLERLNLPTPDDPQDTWRVVTAQGQGWADQYRGQTLAWEASTQAQRLYDWVLLLHTGEGAWLWAVFLCLSAASIPLFWYTGLLMWWQARRSRPRLKGNSPLTQADSLIFVASEGGSTWGFAQALHDALKAMGRQVHTTSLENWRVPPAARHVYILAATYGEGQPPAHAQKALKRIASQPPTDAQVAVLGFGDRQFPDFCGFANALEHSLRERGWQPLMALERIHQQSPQEFARWGRALSDVLGQPVPLAYQPRLPRMASLTLLSRQDFPGAAGQPAVILRFALPDQPLARFAAGDLLGILPPGEQSVPRYYSLASGKQDGFVEICVRHTSGGVCSPYLHSLHIGDTIQAFIRPNPGFTLTGSRRPVVLIGAGTGVAPLAGFIRDNTRHRPMYLYYGTRDCKRDFYFGKELKDWQTQGNLRELHTTFSRMPDGGGYVQNAVQRDAQQIRTLLEKGALVRVCGSRPMAQAVKQELDTILMDMGKSLAWLKENGRYAEDLF